MKAAKLITLKAQPNILEKPSTANWSVLQRTLRGRETGRSRAAHFRQWKIANLRLYLTGEWVSWEVKCGKVRLRLGLPSQGDRPPIPHRLESRGGLGWLEGFNEWMVRCGLEFAGHPGTDEFIDNTGNPSTLNLTLHGKIQNIPASDYEISVDPEPPIAFVFEARFMKNSSMDPSSNS